MTYLQALEDPSEDGGADGVEAGEQGGLVPLAVENAFDSGDQRGPALAELGEEGLQALGSRLVTLAGGEHGADDWLPILQISLDFGAGRELRGELEDLLQGLVTGAGALRKSLEELAEADAWDPAA
jgi:hypothetical protein